jgi:hypothetical protein
VRLPRRSPTGEGGLVDASSGRVCRASFVSGYGAIAQLGERMLCKHEVVGSIPSGSTTLRPSGFAWHGRWKAGEACPAKLSKSEDGLLAMELNAQISLHIFVRENTLRIYVPSPGCQVRDI